MEIFSSVIKNKIKQENMNIDNLYTTFYSYTGSTYCLECEVRAIIIIKMSTLHHVSAILHLNHNESPILLA